MKKRITILIICLFSLQCEKGWLREIVNPTVEGCNIPTACNYNPDVNKFDGSCENKSCIDCGGIAHGVSTIDSCGTCDAVASNDCVKDCEDVWGGSKMLDCNGICDGTNLPDRCNVCDIDPSNDCVSDCAGIWGGSAVKDECDICGGDDNNGNGTCDITCPDDEEFDCSGMCGGFSIVDLCEVCGGNNACLDCAGIPNGKLELDNCGNCLIDDNYGAYEHTATILGGIVLSNGEQLGDTDDIFAAFDEEGNVRGVAIQLFPPFGPYMGTPVFEMQMRSNTNGNLLHFKYYDASEDAILDIVETYEFIINETLGNLVEPLVFNIGSSDSANNVVDWVANACVQDCEGVWGGSAVIDMCGICEGNNDCEGIDCTDNTSDYCQDLSVLQMLIDNSQGGNNPPPFDLSPLDLGLQVWEEGRLVGFCLSDYSRSQCYKHYQLFGYFPPEIGNLVNLKSLDLNGQFSGDIPSEIGNLTNLTKLYLSGNQLTGEIPPEIGNLVNLIKLSLSDNQFSGEIPPEVWNLVNLEGLFLSDNQLSGEIPPEIGNLTNLISLYLGRNELNGEIPPDISNIVNLYKLVLSYNKFSGEIPESICNLTNLQGVTFTDNLFCPPYPECLSEGQIGEQDTSECPVQDCAGTWGGTSVVDCAGVCEGSAEDDTDGDGICDNLQGTVDDIHGNTYKTIKIGDQTWMAENLKVTHYNNGDEITHITNNADWDSYDEGLYAVYDNAPANADIYGNLYNWAVINDERGVCPEGFHVPSDGEWTILTDFIAPEGIESWGSNSIAGGKMKEVGLEHWNSPNEGATNESGFTGLPAGYRPGNGYYNDKGSSGYFWSSSASESFNAMCRGLAYNDSSVSSPVANKVKGFSVRCLSD